MKVLILTSRVPFVHGGAEELSDHLERNMRRRGIDAQAIRIPFTWEPPERLIEEILLARMIQLTPVDRIISLKFPAYLVPYPKKTLWLLHQYRQAYDLWDAGQSNLPSGPRGEQLKSIILRADNEAFSQASRIFTNAETTRQRLLKYNGFNSVVLPPPVNDPELFAGGMSEGYILAAGRINDAKRQHLLVRALKYAPNVNLVIAGPPDTSADADRIRRTVENEGVGHRVRLELGFVERRTLANLVNHALAVAYLPFDEDSVGYVTMEAFQAGKPVLTTVDSGGVLELVKDGMCGYSVAPTPEELGRAMVILSRDAERSAHMGKEGKRELVARGLTWDGTLERLLS